MYINSEIKEQQDYAASARRQALDRRSLIGYAVLHLDMTRAVKPGAYFLPSYPKLFRGIKSGDRLLEILLEVGTELVYRLCDLIWSARTPRPQKVFLRNFQERSFEPEF